MAFQAPALPSIVAVTTELWPSVLNTVMAPFRSPALNSKRNPIVASRVEPSTKIAQQTATQPKSSAILPEFLRDSSNDATIFSLPRYTSSPLDVRSSISTMQRSALIASNPVVHRLYPQRLSYRPLSTSPLFRAPLGPISRVSPLQRRSFQSGGLSRNLLGHMEESANRNPTSATAQNAFYQALLKANMPAIIVERYQSGRFASNPAATAAYQRALGMLTPNGGHVAPNENINDAVKNLPGNLTSTQVQAVTQALAAQSRGGSLAVAKGGAQATGAKDGPLHVVVDESIGSSVFRWVRFLMWFCLITYFSLVVVTMLIEGMSVLKRPGSKVESEAKAEQQKARFSDVHGADEAKEELQEMVEFLRNPEKFSQLGGKLPKGVLLVGPPGTGKTLLARAVAGEAGVPFFYMSGSEFDEVYVGVGAKRVRELFAAAKAKSPSIVFIDELDAIGGRRNARDAAYVKQTLNQLLTELDGFDQTSNVIIIGATNFPELLDKALTRPGRFDRHVRVELPDTRGRVAILQHHAKKIKASKEVDLKAIAMATSGLSGAELENIVNQAAVHASKSKASSVRPEDFEWAKDRVIMGAERKTMVITPKEKEMTAYHEAGHALVGLLTKHNSNQLYKVTVLPRGPSLGHTASLPEMDKYSVTVANFLANIDVSLGGKSAEEIVYGVDHVTSGASSDLESATRIAFHIVARLGMSQKLGNMTYGKDYDKLSSETRAAVEAEVQRTLQESYERARQMLLDHRKELDLLAQALIKYETLSREEVEKVIRGEDLPNRIASPPGPMVVPMPAKIPGPGEITSQPGDEGDSPPPRPPRPAPPAPGGLSSGGETPPPPAATP
ncbi:peptidase family M41-domain-containing protein [Xylariomycetidae sp. FL2044]|nr:peptidase family M41-domain-containing protein [Xylariomycetidae sp. FL2044]